MQFSEERINAIKDQGLVDSAEARRSSVPVAALDAELIARARVAGGGAALSNDEYLVRRRLADHSGASLVLREAAVLLFAQQAETIDHPNAGIRVFRVRGTERLTGVRHNVQEFPRIEGNLPSVLQNARALLETLIQRSARLHDLFFHEMSEYPTFAWQEALVNAVAHRDYGIRGQAVEVFLYDDRLEVLSPGAPPSQVSLDDLRLGRPAHASRNPRITRVLVELSVMREQGEGIPRMFEEMEISYLPLPQLDIVGGRFVVTLRNEPIFQSGAPEWAQAVRAQPLAVTQKRALVGFFDREFANADYCQLNRVDRDTAYRELHELVSLGFVSAVGTGAGTRYRVAREAIPAAPATAMKPIEQLTSRMSDVGFMTNSDYREAFDVDRHNAKTALGRWVAEGFLTREGTRRHAKYRATKRWPPL